MSSSTGLTPTGQPMSPPCGVEVPDGGPVPGRRHVAREEVAAHDPMIRAGEEPRSRNGEPMGGDVLPALPSSRRNRQLIRGNRRQTGTARAGCRWSKSRPAREAAAPDPTSTSSRVVTKSIRPHAASILPWSAATVRARPLDVRTWRLDQRHDRGALGAQAGQRRRLAQTRERTPRRLPADPRATLSGAPGPSL